MFDGPILKGRKRKKEKKGVWNSEPWYSSVFVVHLFGVVEQAGCCHCVLFLILHISTLQILITCSFLYKSFTCWLHNSSRASELTLTARKQGAIYCLSPARM